jgi:hypothetical protein
MIKASNRHKEGEMCLFESRMGEAQAKKKQSFFTLLFAWFELAGKIFACGIQIIFENLSGAFKKESS